MPDEFHSTGSEVEAEFGVRKFSYNLPQLVQLATSFKENNFFIARTYTIATAFIWPNTDPEFIVEMIENMDHLRRGEPAGWIDNLSSDWVKRIKYILCPQKHQL